jgi:two-component system, LytTR family, response regulator
MSMTDERLVQSHAMTPAPFGKIGMPVRDGFVFLAAHDIIRCEAQGAYSMVYYGAGKKLMLSKNLSEMEVLLQHHIFFRTHQSAIINVEKIHRYFRGKGGEVEMEDGSLVPVSAQRKRSFLEKLAIAR